MVGVPSPETGRVLGWARVPVLIPIPAIFHPSLSPWGGHLWANPFPGCCGVWPPGMEGLGGTAD